MTLHLTRLPSAEQRPADIRPNSLIILLTNRCTATCGHCCMNSSKTRQGSVGKDAVLSTIRQMHEAYGIKLVVFAGGEPTLTKTTLFDAIALCGSLGVLSRVVTNASWATTPAKAEQMIDKLRGAGLMDLNISCDDYHLPFIPFSRVVNAWKASKGKGFQSVALCTALLRQDAKITPEFIQEQIGEKLPYRFEESGVESDFRSLRAEDGTVYALSNARLAPIGRGAVTISEDELVLEPAADILARTCPSVVNQPALTPGGDLVGCCGFEMHGNDALDFGAVTADNVAELVSAANRNPVVRMLHEVGPGVLVKFLNRVEGVPIRTHYTGICHACHDVLGVPENRAKLVKHLPRLRKFLHRIRLRRAGHAPAAGVPDDLLDAFAAVPAEQG